jgi:hypothetical protein
VAILHQLLFLSASQEPMYAFRDRSPQLRTTDELRDFAGTALDSIPSGYTPREWAIDAARPRSDPGSHFDRHNHMLAMPDRDGKLAAVVIFHRDPRIREQVGIAIATAAGAELRPASDLTAVLSQYAVTPERAQAPATSHASDGVH